MDTPHQMRLLQRRLDQARAEADEMARLADILANNLAAALNRLQPHDPEFVRSMAGEAVEPAPEPAEPPLSPPDEAPAA